MEPDNHYHSLAVAVWLHGCLSGWQFVLLSSLFGEDDNFGVGITPRDNLIWWGFKTSELVQNLMGCYCTSLCRTFFTDEQGSQRHIHFALAIFCMVNH